MYAFRDLKLWRRVVYLQFNVQKVLQIGLSIVTTLILLRVRRPSDQFTVQYSRLVFSASKTISFFHAITRHHRELNKEMNKTRIQPVYLDAIIYQSRKGSKRSLSSKVRKEQVVCTQKIIANRKIRSLFVFHLWCIIINIPC